MSAEDVLAKAEAYERRTRTPTLAEFLRTENIQANGVHPRGALSPTQFRVWRRGYGLDYPMVPLTDAEDRRLVVFYIDDRPPHHVRWVAGNIASVFGYEPAQVLQAPFADLVCGPQAATVHHLFAAPRRGAAHHRTPPTPLCLMHQDGRELHVQVHAHYGPRSGAWYTTVAELDSAVEADDAEPLFNVEPYLVAPMALTVKRSLRGHSAGRAAVTGHVGSGKSFLFARETTRAWLEHAERHLGQDEG